MENIPEIINNQPVSTLLLIGKNHFPLFAEALIAHCVMPSELESVAAEKQVFVDRS